MSRLKNNLRIYSVTLRANINYQIFADERAKKKFLDTVLRVKVKSKEYMEIFAFCVMDAEACLLVAALEDRQLDQMIHAIGEKMKAHILQVYKGQAVRLEGTYVDCGHLTLQQMIEKCRCIHAIPVEQHYVRCMEDYWWSSYKDYIQKYRTGLVCPETLLRVLSTDNEEAIQKFVRYHKYRYI